MLPYTATTQPWNKVIEQITSVTTSEEITSVGSFAFYRMSNLTKITLNEGLTSIHSNAFESCSIIISIDILSTITTIRNNAFGNCQQLIEVIYVRKNKNEQHSETAFEGWDLLDKLESQLNTEIHIMKIIWTLCGVHLKNFGTCHEEGTETIDDNEKIQTPLNENDEVIEQIGNREE